MSSVGSEVA